MFKPLQTSYINISGNLYDVDFINLINIKDEQVCLDDRTRFLTADQKETLNLDQLKKVNDSIYIVDYDGVLGLLCDYELDEESDDQIKAHELVIPDVVQGMVSNYSQYNGEAAPVLLSVDENLSLKEHLKTSKLKYEIANIKIYQPSETTKSKILEKLNMQTAIYVADGHHRIFSTRLSNCKQSVFSFVVPLCDLEIDSIDRVIQNISNAEFNYCLEFLDSRNMLIDKDIELQKGIVKMIRNQDIYTIKLIDLKSDAFWNNDVYRLNTQILSQGFRIYDSSNLKYFKSISYPQINLAEDEVLLKTYPMTKKDFTDATKDNQILPPKTTFFSPKFPSFLVIKEY